MSKTRPCIFTSQPKNNFSLYFCFVSNEIQKQRVKDFTDKQRFLVKKISKIKILRTRNWNRFSVENYQK